MESEKSRILVVDDSESGRYVLAHSLRQAGYEVLEAATGGECLEQVRAGNCDLVLLDVKLPDISGIEVCRRLKADPKTALIPVIQISALLTTKNDRISGLESGADAYLASPFEPRELLAHVTGLLRVRAAEERLRQTIEFNPQIHWTATPEGKIEDFGERWLALTGLTRDEALGDGWMRVQSPEDLPKMRAAWERAVKTGQPYDLKHRSRTADGTYRWMHTRAFPHKIRGGKIARWFGFSEDIQARVVAESALKENQELLCSIYSGVDAAIAVSEVVKDGFGFRILTANRACEEWSGIPLERWIGHRIEEFLPAEDAAAVGAHYRVALAGGKSITYEERVNFPAGATWALTTVSPLRDAEGRIRRVVATSIDITEQKQAQQEVQRLLAAVEKERDRIASLVNSITDEVWFMDTEKRLTLANPSVVQEFGLASYDTDVQRVAATLEVLRPDGTPRPLEEAPLLRAVKGEVVRNAEEIIRTPATGELRHRQVNASPVRDAAGEIIGSVSVVRDITEQKQANAALATAARIPAENPDGVMRLKDGRTLDYANQPATELIQTLNAGSGGVPAELTEPAVASLQDGKRREVEISCEDRTYLVNFAPIQAGGYVNVYARDITAAKQAETALRESELFHRQTLESIPGMVFTTRPDGYCDYQSQQWVDYTGIPMVEHLGQGWLRLLHPEDQQKALDCWKAAVEGRASYDLEYRVQRRDGEYEWFKVRGRPIRNKAGQIVRWFGVAANINKLKQTEDALRVSEERFRAIFESTSDCILVWDRNYNYLYANQASIDHVGTTRDQVVGKNIRDGLGHVPEFMRLWMTRVDRTFATGESFRVEDAIKVGNKVVYSESQISPIRDTAGRVFAAGVVYRDVTERKEAQEALRAAEERLRTLLKATGVGLWLNELPLGKLNWDARTRELFFVGPEEESTIELFWSRLHPDDREPTRLEVESALRENRVYTMDHRAVDPVTGWVRWVHSEGKGVYDREGKLVRFDGVNYDITERKAFQAELERLVAERTAKLHELVHELEHFSYTITHDMRAPLRAMQGFAEIASDALTSNQIREAQELLERMKTSALRMDSLITDALNYSKTVRNELPLGPVDVGGLLRGMLDSYPEFQKDRANITIEGDLPIVMGNEAGLTQCFSNLLGNAVKFVEPGKKANVRVWGTMQHGWVRLWVEDKGIGIAPGMLPRVFDMFTRGSNSQAGTGIGLALVRKVVDRMGGKVGVESEPGHGSRFWIELRSGK